MNTCKRLQENKYPLMREAVDRLGIDVMQELVDEVFQRILSIVLLYLVR